MKFFTAVNCMDGRVQIPVITYLKEKFQVDFIDSITDAGPCRYFQESISEENTETIFTNIKISVEKHNSSGIAVAAHHDCAGNPVEKENQVEQVNRAVKILKEKFPGKRVIGLWVNQDWEVEEI